MHSRTVAFSLLVMTGCGGNVAPVEDVPADAAVPLLFQSNYVGFAPPPGGQAPSLSYQCLPKPLPLGPSDLPDCVVVEARFPPGAGTPNEVDACQQCGEPGLEPFVSTVPLDQIGEGLAQFQCLCQVVPLPRSAACPAFDGAGTTSSWCYGENAAHIPTTECPGGNVIGFSGVPASDASLFVACFSPSTSD